VHVDDEELEAYLPAGQVMHSAAPVWLLYLPAMHGTQVPPLGPDEPALHMQAVKAELPAGASECVGQSKQVESAVAPTAAEYLPVAMHKCQSKQIAHC
jgi:hypothetical protein